MSGWLGRLGRLGAVLLAGACSETGDGLRRMIATEHIGGGCRIDARLLAILTHPHDPPSHRVIYDAVAYRYHVTASGPYGDKMKPNRRGKRPIADHPRFKINKGVSLISGRGWRGS